jgi:hypothetical protein
MLKLLQIASPKRTHRLVVLGCAAAIACTVYASPVLGEAPDPIALLRGLEETRASIRSGKVEMAVTNQQLRPWDQKDEIALTIIFDGDKRTASQRQRVLVIDASGPDGGESKNKRLTAMNHDREAFVRAGLGKWRNDHIRSGWDGSNFCQFSETMGAAYRSHSQGTPEMVFDPRLLGLLAYYEMKPTLADCLYYRKAKSIQLIGGEHVAGRPTWHVLVTSPAGVERRFWIEDREGFRVHKFVFKDSSVNKIMVSEYDENIKGASLPTQVTSQTFTKDGQLNRELVVRVTKVELNVSVDSNIGTIASLGLPVGEAVADERIGRRLGYWNGNGLSDNLLVAKQISQERQAEAERYQLARNIGLAITAGIMVLVAVFVLRRRLKARHA